MKKLVIMVRGGVSEGDSEIPFDEANPEQVAKARAEFDRLLQKEGCRAFAVNREGGKEDKLLKSFDEVENETIIIGRVVGG